MIVRRRIYEPHKSAKRFSVSVMKWAVGSDFHNLHSSLLTWQIAVLVLFQMTVEVGLLAEAAVAQVALEGLLLVVDVANVTLQVGGDAEGAVTVFTPAETIRVVHLKSETTRAERNNRTAQWVWTCSFCVCGKPNEGRTVHTLIQTVPAALQSQTWWRSLFKVKQLCL